MKVASVSLLHSTLAERKLPPDFPAADELRQEAVVAAVVADAAGDDCGVDVGFAGESVDCEYGGSFTHRAGVPEAAGE